MIVRRGGRALLAASTVALAVGLGVSGCSASPAPRHLVGTSDESSTRVATATPTPQVTTKDVAVTSAIPFTATTVNDASVPQGTSSVTTAGVDGVLTTTYRVTYTDGVETGREQISQAVTQQPVSQVTTVGTYVAPPPAAPVGSGATALCNDGTLSYAAHHQGACSHHGGVAQFYR